MTKDEALKMALEALENIDKWLPTIGQRGLRDYEADAITAIKAALLTKDVSLPEQEQEPFDGRVIVGFNKLQNGYFVYEETELNEYCAIKGPFSTKLEAEDAMRNPAAPLMQAQPEQEPVLQDIEQYRMQMAGISTAALGYWKDGDGIHPDYDTVELRDVAKLYAKYDALYKARWAAQPEQYSDLISNGGLDPRNKFDAQPEQEPVAFYNPQHGGFYWAKPTTIHAPQAVDIVPLALYTSPPQRQEEQEPVAWMVYTQDGKSVYVTDNPTDIQEGQRALPLYTGATT